MSDGRYWASPSGGQPGPGQPGPPPYGQAPYGMAPYGQAPYGMAPYGQAPYGQGPYGPFPYGQPPYGHPGHPGWPAGARRPTVVTSAGVLGIVTGGLTGIGSLFMLLAAFGGDDDPATVLLVLGLPCAAGLIAGGARLLQGHRAGLLFGSALTAIGVLFLALVAGLLTLGDGGRFGITAFVLFASVLPIVTAVLAKLRGVTDWVEG
ncbi:hypothetical protein [Blastococcus montanus]|uniref:hypothetical protein n=1 Tax=Blastococcus montanus TaxID=3144973 RepID=UPI003208874E